MIYTETFTVDGWNNDLSYLKGEVKDNFSKIFYHLYEVMENHAKKENGKQETICNSYNIKHT